MFSTQDIYNLLLMAGPLLFSLTVHEFAHARTAQAFGDNTARLQGRCTLNPLSHLDPVGTICLLLTRMVGWAKPVPVNIANLHPRRLGDIMVSLAGPLSNLSLAIVCGVILKAMLAIFGWGADGTAMNTVYTVLLYTMVANISLFAFNLLPLFPLDGHHVVRELLPEEHHQTFMAWQTRYGPLALAGLIFLPRVLEMGTKREVFDPLTWMQSHLAVLAIKLLVS